MKRPTIIVESDSSDSEEERNSTEDYIEQLALQIQSRIDATSAQLERLTSPKNDEPTTEILDQVLINSNEAMQQRLQQHSSPSGNYGKISPIYSPVSPVKEIPEEPKDDFITPQKGPLFTNDTIETPNLSAIASSPLSTFGASKLPKSPNGSVRRGATQETFDRMYREAEAVKERKEQLKIVTEMERVESVKKSSFIENYRNSPSHSRRGRSTSPTGSVTSGGSGYKRTPIKRSNSATRLLDPSESGRLYYNQLEWVKDKEANTERLKQQITKDRLALEDVNLTLQPRLQTSASMQVQRSQSSHEIFDVLYKSHQFYESKKEDLRLQLEDEFYAKNRFIPQITPKSKKIVSRKMQERQETETDRHLSESNSTGYLFEEGSAAGLGASASTDALSVVSGPASLVQGTSSGTSGRQQPPKSPLHVMSADRLHGKSLNSRKTVKRAELKKTNDRRMSRGGLEAPQQQEQQHHEEIAVIPTVVEVASDSAAVNAVPVSEKESHEADESVTQVSTFAHHVTVEPADHEAPDSGVDDTSGLWEHFEGFRQALADVEKPDSSSVPISISNDAASGVIPSANSPKVGAEWNPFDFNSKHYRSRSPPTLLKTSAPSPGRDGRGRSPQPHYLPYSPNHRSTYRALRESGSLGMAVPITSTGAGMFSVGTSAYSQLQQRQHEAARVTASAAKDSNNDRADISVVSSSSRKVVDGPYPSSASAYGDANISLVGGGEGSRPRSAERGRNTAVSTGRNKSRMVQGVRGEEVPIEQYYARGRDRSRSRSPGSATRGSSANRLRNTPSKRGGGGGGVDSAYSTPNRRSDADSQVRRSVDSAEKSLFDRLYEARFESALEMEECRARHTPIYTHQPDIGTKNSKHEIEKDKDAFFTRLYDQYESKIVTEEARKALLESQRLSEIAATSVRAGRVLKLTAEEEAKSINRLLESKSKVETKVQQTKNEIDKSLAQLQHSRFIQQRSNAMASKAHSRALSEIFTVLCVTALHAADLNRKEDTSTTEESGTTEEGAGADTPPTDTSDQPSSSSTAKKVLTVLDVALAQPGMLQPKVLADAMTFVLQSLVEQQKHHFAKLRKTTKTESSGVTEENGKEQPVEGTAATASLEEEEEQPLPPLLVNRDQFIAEVLHHMATGALPPIGYILSQPERESKPVRQNNAAKLMRSEDLAALKCKDKPDLAAKRTTDVLVKGRYKLRMLGQEKVEDSLLSYVDFKEHKLYEKKVELEKEMKKICTFTPQVNEVVPSYILRRQQLRQQQQQQQTQTASAGDGGSVSGSVRSGSVNSRSKRSSSAPPKQSKNPPKAGTSEPAVVVSENVAPEPNTSNTSGGGTGYIEDYFLINTAPTMYHKVKSHLAATSRPAVDHSPVHQHHATPHQVAPAAVAAFHNSVIRSNSANHISSGASVSSIGSSVSNMRSAPAARLQQPRPSSSASATSHSYASAYDALRERMKKDLYIDSSIATESTTNNYGVGSSNSSVASGTVIRGSTPKASYVYSGNNRTNNVMRDGTAGGSAHGYSTPGNRGDFSALYQRR